MKTRIYLMDTEPFRDPIAARRIYQALPESRRKKADQYKNPEDRLRALASGALLLKLCDEENLPASMEDLTENPYGKPYFALHQDICFSLSHSGTKVLLAASDRAIGCDIEVIRERLNIMTIASRYYSPEEYQMLQAEADPDAYRRLFYRLWTLRESFVKETGLGLYLPLRSFCIRIDPANAITVHLTETPEAHFAAYVSENVSFFEYEVDEQYRCSCCISQEDGPMKKPELIPVQV